MLKMLDYNTTTGDADENYVKRYFTSLKVVVLAWDEPDYTVKEAEIVLNVNWMGRAAMADLDGALNAAALMRPPYGRVYWMAGPNYVLPMFNNLTLSAALHTMANSNHIIYLIKKEAIVGTGNSNSLYKVDPQDKELILSATRENDPRSYTGYTRFEEATHQALAYVARGEHLPQLSTLSPAPPPSTPIKGSKGNKSKKATK